MQPPPKAPSPPVEAFVFWLGSIGLWWFALVFVVPAFEKMFREVGLALSWGRQAVLAASHVAQSPLGALLGAAVVMGSIGAFSRWRAHRRLEFVLWTVSVVGWLFVVAAIVTLFMYEGFGCEKL